MTAHPTGEAGSGPRSIPPPPAGSVVVVHWGVPGAAALDPADRRVRRWVLASRNDHRVVIAVVEPPLGTRPAAVLDGTDVPVVVTGAHTNAWLTEHRRSIDAVVIGDLALAHVVGYGRRSDLPPLWLLEPAPLPRAPTPIEPDEVDGKDSYEVAAHERASVIAALARRVVTTDPPAVPAGRGPDNRVVVVDRFARGVTASAEAGIRWFVDNVAPRLRAVDPAIDVRVAGVDASPRRRAVIGPYALEPDAVWPAIAGAAAVVVLAGADDAVLAALHDIGIEPVVVDAGAPVEAAVAACTAALARPARNLAVPERLLPSRAGTLAAHDAGTEAFAREVYGAQQLPWVQALIANRSVTVDRAYRRWLRVHHANADRAAVLRARAGRLSYRPLISVVTPVHDTEPAALRAMVESVRAQLYPRWELCLADDGSTSTATIALLTSLAATDERVRLRRTDESRGIAAATNSAVALARGEFVAFVDHDDVLAPDALYWIVRRLELDSSIEVLYTDEDKLDGHGCRVEPYFKPDWSPDYLLSLNYITHLLVVRRRLLDRVGGLREVFDGAQDYDLVLRLAEHTDRIAHIPAPLYSWRKVQGSTAADIHAKPAAHRASERALDEALTRRGVGARREPGRQPTWHRVRYRIDTDPKVSIVIPTRDRVDLLQPCVDRVRQTVARREIEFVIVDNDSRDPATLAYLDRAAALADVKVVRYPHRFNFARQMNLAALAAHGDVLLFLNNDVRPAHDGWLDAMLEHALRPEVGAVGARLRWPDGRAQHEGIVLNAGGVALNLDSGPFDAFGACVRNVAAVTAACLMTRASVFAAIGGMDDRLRVAYNDVDLCLRLGEVGYRIIYTPYAELEHAESSSRGKLHPTIDEDFYQSRWGPPYTRLDPFYSPNLELMQPWSPRL